MVTLVIPVDESVPVPRLVDPYMKSTVPPGVPVPGLLTVTVAVSVTGCP